MTTVCFGFASAALAYIAKSNGPSRDMLGLSVFLTILGLLAALLTYKQYERFRLAMDRAEQFRKCHRSITSNPTDRTRSSRVGTFDSIHKTA